MQMREAFLTVVALALAGCGGGNSSPSSASTTPSSSTGAGSTRVVLVTKPFTLAAGTATFQNADNLPAGTVDATLDWGGGNDMNLYVTDNTCSGFANLRAGACAIVARAESTTSKPERVSFNTTAGKTYTFWIYNNGASQESGQLEVGETTSGEPVAQPSPTPGSSTDPQSDLAPGPVYSFAIKVRTIDQGSFDYRDPFQDQASGFWIVHPNEFVVFDSTQKNINGDRCKYKNDPEWFYEDPDGVFSRRGSSQPFLLRVDIVKKGLVKVWAVIDGVDSRRDPRFPGVDTTLYVESKR